MSKAGGYAPWMFVLLIGVVHSGFPLYPINVKNYSFKRGKTTSSTMVLVCNTEKKNNL